MSDTTKIQWADATFNPWIGCTKVSPGCANCYAENETFVRVQRASGHELWGKGKERHRTSGTAWKQPLNWNKKAVRGGFRMRVFPSMCDWLDNEVPVEWLADFLKLIYETPHLDWLLLTKRPENFLGALMLAGGKNLTEPGDYHPLYFWIRDWMDGKPPRNVWVGVSVEDQKRADERIPLLLNIPAKVRFLSCEPLLGPVNILGNEEGLAWPLAEAVANNEGFNWVIVGGESGAKARPCNVAGIRSIVAQCRAAGVACFVKQLGAHCVSEVDDFPCHMADIGKDDVLWWAGFKDKKGGDMAEWPADLRVRQFPEVVR